MLNPKTGQEVTGTPGYVFAEKFEALKEKYQNEVLTLTQYTEINEQEAVSVENNGSSGGRHFDCNWYSAQLILDGDICDEFSFYVKREINNEQ
jgi:hypothetical protein